MEDREEEEEEKEMTTVKKPTISTKVFEKRIITLIKLVKGMDMPDNTNRILLDELRLMHNGCLEWTAPSDDFEIIKELRT